MDLAQSTPFKQEPGNPNVPFGLGISSGHAKISEIHNSSASSSVSSRASSYDDEGPRGNINEGQGSVSSPTGTMAADQSRNSPQLSGDRSKNTPQDIDESGQRFQYQKNEVTPSKGYYTAPRETANGQATSQAPIPPLSSIMSQTEESAQAQNGLPVRFRPIFDPNTYADSNTPAARETYQNNGLQTVFLPFKRGSTAGQLQSMPNNSNFSTLLPPPVRQVGSGIVAPSVKYASQLSFIPQEVPSHLPQQHSVQQSAQHHQPQPQPQPQAQSQPQPQTQTQTQTQAQAQGQAQPQVQYQYQSQHPPQMQSNFSQPAHLQAPGWRVSEQQQQAQNKASDPVSRQSLEPVVTSQSLGQPVSHEQLEARDNFMVNFRLRPENKKSSSPSKLKPYRCSFPNCSWSFARQSDLRRHSKSHEAPQYYCPYWRKDQTCHKNGGAFNRLDVLKRHLRLVHYIPDFHAGSVKSKNDSGWCKACQKMFPNSKMFVEHCALCASSIDATKWSQTRQEDDEKSMEWHSSKISNGNPNPSDEFLKDAADLYDPNSNLITLSTVINEFETNQQK